MSQAVISDIRSQAIPHITSTTNHEFDLHTGAVSGDTIALSLVQRWAQSGGNAAGTHSVPGASELYQKTFVGGVLASHTRATMSLWVVSVTPGHVSDGYVPITTTHLGDLAGAMSTQAIGYLVKGPATITHETISSGDDPTNPVVFDLGPGTILALNTASHTGPIFSVPAIDPLRDPIYSLGTGSSATGIRLRTWPPSSGPDSITYNGGWRITTHMNLMIEDVVETVPLLRLLQRDDAFRA